MDITVSVIVPAYNAAATLARCLDSVLPQLDGTMELIVADDASTDGTLSLLTDYRRSHPAVTVIHSTVNHGVARARNDGIRFARGQYVAFCDADDEWAPGKLAQQLAWLEAHPGTDLVFTADSNLSDDGSEGAGRILEMSGDGQQCHLRTCLARKEVFDRIGLLDESLRVREDTEWIVRAITSGCKYGLIPETLYIRHILGTGLSAGAPAGEAERGRRVADAFVRGIRRKTFTNPSDRTLSILIPCRNAGKYIAEAVGSCRSGFDEEIILVDDGSTDDSAGKAVQALRESGIPALTVLRAHRGQAASRNDALALARGEWILYLDADDHFLPGAVDEAMRLALDSGEDTYLLSFLCKDFISPELTPEQAAALSANPEPYRRMLAGCMLGRRALYDRIGGFDESLPSSETAQWVLRVRSSGLGILDTDLVTLARRYHMTNFGRVSRTTQMESYLAIIRSRLKNK